MANVPRSSFIPKQSTSATPHRVRKMRVFSIIGTLSVVFLVASVALAGGVFFYKTYVGKSLEGAKASLETERARFSESDIETVEAFDRQLQAVEYLLDHHVIVSHIFDALERTAKESVQYTNFALDRRPSGGVTVTLGGVTDEFAKLALQSMQYEGSSFLDGAVVTDISLGTEEEEGDNNTNEQEGSGEKQVQFAVTANVEGSDIPFNPTAPAEPAPTSTPAFETDLDVSDTATGTAATGTDPLTGESTDETATEGSSQGGASPAVEEETAGNPSQE